MRHLSFARRLLCLCLPILVVAGVQAALAAPAQVLYPRPETAGDPRTDYPVTLLRLALAKSGGQFTLQPTRETMLQGRALSELATGSGSPRVVWSMTSREREKALLPIRIPIYKGLIGWRIPLIHKHTPDLLKGVSSLDDLKLLRTAQGHDWPDTEILRAAQLNVSGVVGYESLFNMLHTQRIDYFPRSLAEVWAELKVHSAKDITLDPHVVLHYDTAFYYFVNNQDTALAQAIERGLEAAIADGSFDRLFYQHYASLIKRAELDKRVIIELPNPLLPPETPLGRKELWFRPAKAGLTAR